MRNALLLLVVLTPFIFVYSQGRQGGEGFAGGTVEGRVLVANSNEKVEYANVVVLSSVDSSVLTGTVTDADGKFNIERLRPGKYFVDIRFIGFKDRHFNIEINRNNLNINLGDIFIEPVAINLENVIVEDERSPVSYQLDKKVIDVDQMQTVVSGNAADVLENVPSVTVDIEGNVSLRGSGNFTVLIDGRPSIMDAQDVLQQTAASSIKSIEIITNPSAKYNPEGTAGIINIILKKNQNLGLSGVVNANAGLNDKYGGDFLFEYKAKDVNTTFGIDYNKRIFPGDGIAEQRFILNNNTSFLNSTNDMNWGRTSFGLRGGIDFLFSEKDVLSLGGRYGDRKNKQNSFQNFVEWSQQFPAELRYTSIGERMRSGDHFVLNMNYFHKFDQNGHELKGEIVYGHNNSDESTLTSELNGNTQVSGKETTEIGPSSEIEGKIDYTLTLGENRKFEAGAQGEADISEEATSLLEYNVQTGIYEVQSLYNNTTKYNRSELALYSIYADQFGKLGIQGGIRGEYTFRTIEVERQNQKFDINRWDIFPSLHSSFKFSEGRQLMASYTRRIERPRGWQLEPFETWMDANNVRQGNPDLQPEYIDSYEFGFQTFIGEIVFSNEIYYRVTHNKVERIRSVYTNDPDNSDITYNSVENVGKDYALGSEFMFVLDPLEMWNINLMGNLYNYKIEGVLYDESFSRESFTWNTRLNNVLKISQGTSLQFNLSYNSSSVSSQGKREGFFSTDAAFKQELFNRKLSLTIQVRDIFSTAKYESTTQGPDFYSYNQFTRESPMVMLNLRYNFNNFKQDSDRQRPDGETDNGEEF